MTNSDFVTISDFFGQRAYIFFLKRDPYPMCAFTLHLVKQAKNSIYDKTNQFE